MNRNSPSRATPLFWLAALFFVQTALAQTPPPVTITEFLADNKNGLKDADGDSSDWIELHNPGDAPAPLAGFALTDDPSRPAKWPLPASGVLPPGGYAIVFASGKNRSSGDEWHANFSLSKSGEYLALTFGGRAALEFSPAFPAQQEDVSYGFLPGSTEPVYLAQPSPGAPNDPAHAGPAPVRIAPAGGTFTGATTVILSSSPGAEIRYTLDGSPPSETSPLYTGPFEIRSSTRLKAAAFANGRRSAFTNAVWVRLSESLAGYTSPLPLLIIENFNGGRVPAKGWSRDGSNVRQVPRQAAAWVVIERDGATASAAGPAQLAGEIGIRGRGAFTSEWTQKPFAIQPRDASGEAAEAAPLGMPANEDWLLYYPEPVDYRDHNMLFNAFSYALSRELGRYAARFRFVEVFLNENGGDLARADRRGVYLLLEKISRGKERLDFDPLSADGSSGGFLLSINRMDAIPETGWPAPNGATTPWFFHTPGPNRRLETPPNTFPVRGDDHPQQSNAFINFEQPNGYRITTRQREAVERWFAQFEDTLYNNATWRDPVNGWRRWLDERDWAGGYLLHNFVRHSDALLLSMYPWVGNDRKLRFGPVWDTNLGGYYEQGAPNAELFYRSSRLWFGRLFQDPDFKQHYIDLWTEWRRGAMSDAAMTALIDRLAAEITPEKAVAQGVPSAEEWERRLTNMKTWVKGRAAFFDASFVPPPSIDPPGGAVPAGTRARLAASKGTVWFHPDGADPRAPGGGVRPGAVSAAETGLAGDVKILARARDGNDWSGPVAAVFAVDAAPASADDLVISEIHYQPAPPTPEETAAGFTNAEDFEFLELANTGSRKISLSGLRFSRAAGGVDFSFDAAADRWTIAPGERVVIVKNRAAFAARYGDALPVAGEYAGNLSNRGETLRLLNADGVTLREISWDARSLSAAPGHSLTLRALNADPARRDSWRSSVRPGGSPGGSDSIPWNPGGPLDWKAYALGDAPAPELSRAPAGDWLLRFNAPPGADDAVYSLEVSEDLRTWQPAGAAWSFQGEEFPGGDGAPPRLVWSGPSSTAAPGRPLFLRVRARPR